MKNSNHWAPVSNFMRFIIFIFALFVLHGCGVAVNYSMSGSATNAQTITIAEFYNNADLGPANLGQVLTNELKNYFIQNSNLSVVQEEGELMLEGEVIGYTITDVAPVANGTQDDFTTAATTRITISVRATYINTLEEKMSFKDKTFSFYRDFPSDQNYNDVEDQLVRQIFEQIIFDIFNASVANW